MFKKIVHQIVLLLSCFCTYKFFISDAYAKKADNKKTDSAFFDDEIDGIDFDDSSSTQIIIDLERIAV